MDRCELCPRRCGADRALCYGVCNAPREAVVRAALPLFYEEPPISGTRGSGTIFFGGCSLHCEYCQNIEISKSAAEGKRRTPQELADIVKALEDKGVHNVNFVTPTHFADQIIAALELYRPRIPVVWNTSGYETRETVKNLLPYVDIFLTDLKYLDRSVAEKYSHAADYPDFAVPAIDLMVASKPLRFGVNEESDLLKQGVVVRHLVLPNQDENTKKTIAVFKEKWEGRAIFSLMGQYTPNGRETHPELKRPLKPIEYKIAVRYAENLGLDDVFVQESGSVGREYVPKFDFS